MDSRLQLRVQRYGWDAAAEFYNDGWEAQLAPAHNSLFEAADIQPGQSVVETASGTGLVTFRLSEIVGEGGTIHASDIAGEMVEDIKARAKAAGVGNVVASRQNAEALEFEDEIAERSVCALGLMYVPDPRAAVAEMARVLRPGGRATAAVWGERRNCGWAEVFPIVDAHVASEVCPMFFATGPKGILANIFEDAGLQDVTETRFFQGLRFENEEVLLTSMMRGGPVALAVKRFTPEVWDTVCAEFLASVAEHRHADGSYTIPGEFVTVSGVKP